VAQTHSGALVAKDHLIDALFERTGVIRVRSLAALDETLKMLTATRLPKGRRLAVLTNSGGEKALAADAAAHTVIELKQPSAPVAKSLAEQIPDFAVVSNPFDYNAYFSGSGEDVFSSDNPAALERCFRTMVEDGYDIAMMLEGARTHHDGHSEPPGNTVHAWIAANRGADRAVALCSVMPEHMPRAHRELLIDNGVAPLQGIDDAMRAIDAAIRWTEKRAEFADRSVDELALPAMAPSPGDGELMTEAEAKRKLKAFGLRVPEGRAVPPNRVAAAADEIGYPVAIKALKPVFPHKAKMGAVVIGLETAADVTHAAANMSRRLRDNGYELDEVLVETMIQDPRRELIVGVERDPRFGHALVFGHGGLAVERVRDVRSTLLPLHPVDLRRFVTAFLERDGFEPATIAAVVEAVAAVATFAGERRERLLSLDVNPLIVTASGEAIAADALILETGDSRS